MITIVFLHNPAFILKTCSFCRKIITNDELVIPTFAVPAFLLWLQVSLSGVFFEKQRDAYLGWSCMSWAYQQQEAAASRRLRDFCAQCNTKWKWSAVEGGEWEGRSPRDGIYYWEHNFVIKIVPFFTHLSAFVCFLKLSKGMWFKKKWNFAIFLCKKKGHTIINFTQQTAHSTMQSSSVCFNVSELFFYHLSSLFPFFHWGWKTLFNPVPFVHIHAHSKPTVFTS